MKVLLVGLLVFGSFSTFAETKTIKNEDTIRIEITAESYETCKETQDNLIKSLKEARRVVLDKGSCRSLVIGSGYLAGAEVLK